jgi:uncharacterized protein YndB with AHSA1/START domain
MTDTKKELFMTRELDAPGELVFEAWIDPELVKQWWGPKGVFIPVCEVDARPGGFINIVMEAGEELGELKGTRWPMEGKFVEVNEPKKIVFSSSAITEGKVILNNQTTVTFHEENGRTTMKVHVAITKALPGSESAIAGMEAGWNQQLDKLVEFTKMRVENKD